MFDFETLELRQDPGRASACPGDMESLQRRSFEHRVAKTIEGLKSWQCYTISPLRLCL